MDYNNYFAETLDPLGQPIPPLTIDLNNSATRYALYLNLIFRPLSMLTANLGVRADYFSATDRFAMSPRISLAWQLSDYTSISAAAGIYQQNIPLNLMAQKNEYRNLADLQAIHFILGLTHRVTESTMFSMEMYYKDYSDFPLDPDQSGLFVIDELYYNYGFFTQHAQLNDQGRAYTYGIEIMLQKKLAEKIYGMISASFFRAAYRSNDGVWRDRVYDNRFVFNVEGGYKPDNKWEFSLRWIFAGGIPFTPFDLMASQAINSGILDGEKINGDRLPSYHSLNIRFDRRFLFSRSNIVLYVSIWNVYNRKNVASYYWDSRINQPGTIYQWGILPIFGIEYEF